MVFMMKEVCSKWKVKTYSFFLHWTLSKLGFYSNFNCKERNDLNNKEDSYRNFVNEWLRFTLFYYYYIIFVIFIHYEIFLRIISSKKYSIIVVLYRRLFYQSVRS